MMAVLQVAVLMACTCLTAMGYFLPTSTGRVARVCATPRASALLLLPAAADVRRQAPGEWTMLSGVFVGSKISLAPDGSVEYVSPAGSTLWRGERWELLREKGNALLVTLISTKSGDKLLFEGEVTPGGEEGSLAFSGRASKTAAVKQGATRWDFAKALAWGDTKESDDVGAFVFLRRAGA